jgi:penicillin-binding protein 2
MVNVMRAITVSCDTFFYTLGVRMGIEALSSRLAWFGFGKKTNIDLPDELPGILPNPTWKRQVKHAAWYPGDTVISSIGQGFSLASPVQLANAVAALSCLGLDAQS